MGLDTPKHNVGSLGGGPDPPKDNVGSLGGGGPDHPKDNVGSLGGGSVPEAPSGIVPALEQIRLENVLA